jgi:hypothetical protein
MKRVLCGLVMSLVAVLSCVGSASASTGQVFHSTFNGTFAEAQWYTFTTTANTSTYINPSRAPSGQEQLFLDQLTENYSPAGDFLGATDTSALVTSGFSFTIDSRTLDTASVTGTSIPAQTCTFDANFNLIGCSDTAIDASANWTGQGPVNKSVSGDHFHTFGFTATDHFSGTSRFATATGNIGGLTLGMGDFAFGDIGKVHSGSVTICIGTNCG